MRQHFPIIPIFLQRKYYALIVCTFVLSAVASEAWADKDLLAPLKLNIPKHRQPNKQPLPEIIIKDENNRPVNRASPRPPSDKAFESRPANPLDKTQTPRELPPGFEPVDLTIPGVHAPSKIETTTKPRPQAETTTPSPPPVNSDPFDAALTRSQTLPHITGDGIPGVSTIPGTLPIMPIAATPSVPFVTFTPYATHWHEIDLTAIERKKFVRSQAVISPDLSQLVWSEVTFMPHTKQTFSSLFLADVPPPPIPPEADPASQPDPPTFWDKLLRRKPPPTWHAPLEVPPEIWARRFDPEYMGISSDTVMQIGRDPSDKAGFATLTVVDWSPSGQRILAQQRKGKLHTGLNPSDIVVIDLETHQIITCTELKNTLSSTLGLSPTEAWDLTPLGWEPQSDSLLLLNVQKILTPTKKEFLGLWRYDLDQHLAEKLAATNPGVALPPNGWVATPNLAPPPAPPKPSIKSKLTDKWSSFSRPKP